MVKEARIAGFGNVHDLLVHRATKETVDQLAARKVAHAWGRWLSLPYNPAAAARSDGLADAAPLSVADVCLDTTSDTVTIDRSSKSLGDDAAANGGEAEVRSDDGPTKMSAVANGASSVEARTSMPTRQVVALSAT
jgi:hypothetical protein